MADQKYYTTLEHLLRVYDESARKCAFHAGTVEDFDQWKIGLRTILADITGMARMKKCEPEPALLESVQLDGYRRDKLVMQTETGVWMPFYQLIPDGLREGEKRACILAPHGHGSCGKEGVAGRTGIPAVRQGIERYGSDYGVSLVREGYVVFCPDARGSGERREWMHQGEEADKMLQSSCTQLNFAAISLGQSLTGMWIWDLMRLIDYIEDCDTCDSARIGCCGFSGGGLQSLWLAAMDDRVKCAVVGGYLHGYRDSLMKTHQCGCNFVPRLWEYVDMGDLGALAAPRPVLFMCGEGDPLNGERGVQDVAEQVGLAREAYRLFDRESALQFHVYAGGHQWNGEKVPGFFAKWLS